MWPLQLSSLALFSRVTPPFRRLVITLSLDRPVSLLPAVSLISCKDSTHARIMKRRQVRVGWAALAQTAVNRITSTPRLVFIDPRNSFPATHSSSFTTVAAFSTLQSSTPVSSHPYYRLAMPFATLLVAAISYTHA